jgi:hypothetical protein
MTAAMIVYVPPLQNAGGT